MGRFCQILERKCLKPAGLNSWSRKKFLQNLLNISNSSNSYRFCFECLNKATGDKNCIVCGNRRPPPVGKMINCELCPRVYHYDCYIPTLQKPPRGKWYCYNCRIKAPPRKKTVKKVKDPKPVVNSTNASEETNNR